LKRPKTNKDIYEDSSHVAEWQQSGFLSKGFLFSGSDSRLLQYLAKKLKLMFCWLLLRILFCLI